MIKARARAAALALFVSMIGSWFASPLTANASSGTMTVTENTTLTADHYGEIVIDADNVTLDCAGHLVTGTGLDHVILIDGRSGVTVIHCRITGGGDGLVVLGSPGPITLMGNTSFSNSQRGYSFWGDGAVTAVGNQATGNAWSGFEAHQSSGMTWRSNSSIGNDIGFNLAEGSNQNTLASNVASGHVGFGPGFLLDDASQNLIVDNVARGNGDGFDLFAGSGNQFRGNSSAHNGGYGFALGSQAFGNSLTANRATGNTYEGIALVYGASNNEVAGNISQGNSAEGISLYYGSDYNVVRGNMTIGNTNSGVLVYQSSNNSISLNRSFMNNSNLLADGGGISVVAGSSFNTILANVACRNRHVDGYDDHTGTGNTWTANHFCTSDI